MDLPRIKRGAVRIQSDHIPVLGAIDDASGGVDEANPRFPVARPMSTHTPKTKSTVLGAGISTALNSWRASCSCCHSDLAHPFLHRAPARSRSLLSISIRVVRGPRRGIMGKTSQNSAMCASSLKRAVHKGYIVVSTIENNVFSLIGTWLVMMTPLVEPSHVLKRKLAHALHAAGPTHVSYIAAVDRAHVLCNGAQACKELHKCGHGNVQTKYIVSCK